MTDLRIVKTRKNIREAFLVLRSRNALEKIRAKELCELALINKTTFYKHYQDVFALSEEIENETVLSIMSSFDRMDSLFTDPDGFIRGLFYAFKSQESLIMTLFSGKMNALINKVEKQLIIYYPPIIGVPEKEIMLSFLLKGASHILMESKFDDTVLLDTVSKVTKQIITIIDVN